jgi:ankyrin repeat protein
MIALGVPGVLLVAATAAMLMGLPFGIDPLWAVEPTTLSEAAALRDNGEVVRLIELGADVNGTSLVRPNIVAERELTMTPLEAAVAAERADMVELLLEQGARVDPAQWTSLMCFAGSVEADDVRALLAPLHTQPLTDDCDRVQIPWLSRSL